MTRLVVLVQCTATKRDEPSPARELYDPSPYFRRQRRYAEVAGDDWYILSAKYGLLEPDTEIEPYDISIADVDDRGTWGRKIGSEIFDRYSSRSGLTRTADAVRFEVLAGKGYAAHFVPYLQDKGFTVCEPLEHLRIGERFNELDRMVARVRGEVA